MSGSKLAPQLSEKFLPYLSRKVILILILKKQSLTVRNLDASFHQRLPGGQSL